MLEESGIVYESTDAAGKKFLAAIPANIVEAMQLITGNYNVGMIELLEVIDSNISDYYYLGNE